MAQSTHTAAALTPLTVTFDDQTVDLSVPQLSPLAELIPTILRSLGRMDVYGASAGFTVSTSFGQLLDQSVIASAPRHGTLCTERRIGNLERRPRVVVESSHKARIELIGNACCRQMLLYLRKVLGASRA